jgi:hypothetical protein
MTRDWAGEERRKSQQPVHCLHEEDWGSLKSTVESLDKRINGSLVAIQKHMDVALGWRVAIIGVILSVVLQVVAFAYLWGSLSNQVETNTKRWERYFQTHSDSMVENGAKLGVAQL